MKKTEKIPKTAFAVGQSVRFSSPEDNKKHGNKKRKVECIMIDATGLHYMLTGTAEMIKIEGMADCAAAPGFTSAQLITEEQYQAAAAAKKAEQEKAKALKKANASLDVVEVELKKMTKTAKDRKTKGLSKKTVTEAIKALNVIESAKDQTKAIKKERAKRKR